PAGGRIPDLHRPIITCGGEALAVGAERHAIDRIHMPMEGESLPARGRIPDLDINPAVDSISGEGEAPAVGAERHGRAAPVEGAKIELTLPLKIVPLEPAEVLAPRPVLELPEAVSQ